VDTAAKRASALNAGCPWRGVLPVPAGAVTDGDRQHVAHHYGGIIASGAVAVVILRYPPPKQYA
jgi:hypothetical protein